MNTFTKRKLEKITIKSVDGNSLTTTDHSGFGLPEWVAPLIKAGDEIYVEYYKFNDIAGLMKLDGEYLFHRTDEYFKQKFEDYLEESRQRQVKWFEENEQDLIKRTAALQPRYKARMERFLNDPDPANSFRFRNEPMGWGYELIICELAQLYTESEGTDDPAVMEFSKKHGTSGNQHDVAKSWAKHSDQPI